MIGVNYSPCSLEEFEYCSQSTADLIRRFGLDGVDSGTMKSIAIFGFVPPGWFNPWAGKIAIQLGYSEPVSCLMRKGDDQRMTFPTANECGAGLVWSCYAELFDGLRVNWDELQKEFADTAEPLGRAVEKYVDANHKTLIKRFNKLRTVIDYPAWLELAAKMDLERTRFVAFERKSPVAEPVRDTSCWPMMSPGELEKLTTFSAEVVKELLSTQQIPNEYINSKRYRVHPEFIANTKALRK